MLDLLSGGCTVPPPKTMTSDTQQQQRAEALGAYLKSLRTGLGLTLREVEDTTETQVSNAYLSQLENGKIAKPSPHILHALASAYHASYEKLMERAGYVPAGSESGAKVASARSSANCSIDNLTAEEEKALLTYLNVWRTMQRREKAK